MMRINRYIFAVILLLSVAGCYVPERFAIGVDMDKEGRYMVRYEGTVVASAILKKIREENLNDKEIREKELPIYQRDFAKLGNIKQLDYIGNGRFQLKMEYIQHVNNGRYALFRPNNKFFSINRNKETGNIIIRGHRMPEKYMERFLEYDIDFKAVVQLVTDAEVIEHNSDQQQQDGDVKILLWRMESLIEDPPIAILRLP